MTGFLLYSNEGSGGLCEALLMVEAYRGNIIAPNKTNTNELQYYGKGQLLDSQTYIGGHVEAFEEGVFREDIPMEFALEEEAYQELIDQVENTMDFFLGEECKSNYFALDKMLFVLSTWAKFLLDIF